MKAPVLKTPIIFISDVHLGAFSDEENRRIESELIQLINYCQNKKIHIAILGDLFDYWMEYPDYIPKLGQELLDRFERFNKKMGPTLYITGNHDNWTGKHLWERGFYLEHEHYSFSLNGNNIMTLHGDGLASSDYSLNRPFLHRILRDERFTKSFQKVFPPKIGIGVMKYFSRFTRLLDWNRNKEEKLNSWAKEVMDDTDIDIILCGHDHIPRKKQLSFGTFINLGSFYKYRTMAFYNNDAISLVSWRAGSHSITQFETNCIDE